MAPQNFFCKLLRIGTPLNGVPNRSEVFLLVGMNTSALPYHIIMTISVEILRIIDGKALF